MIKIRAAAFALMITLMLAGSGLTASVEAQTKRGGDRQIERMLRGGNEGTVEDRNSRTAQTIECTAIGAANGENRSLEL